MWYYKEKYNCIPLLAGNIGDGVAAEKKSPPFSGVGKCGMRTGGKRVTEQICKFILFPSHPK